MNNKIIIDAFNFRHACKEFDPERQVSAEDFNTIMEAARLSPSSFGFEPWHFLVVQDPAIREAILPIFWGGQKQIPTSTYFVLTLVKRSCFMRYDSDFIQHMMRDVQQLPEEIVKMKGDFYRDFQEKDFELCKSNEAMDAWSTHQAYIALGNMMTVAALLGIDSCPMEGFKMRETSQFVAEKCGVDLEKYALAYGVAFGYRVNEPFPKTRQSMDEITTWI